MQGQQTRLLVTLQAEKKKVSAVSQAMIPLLTIVDYGGQHRPNTLIRVVHVELHARDTALRKARIPSQNICMASHPIYALCSVCLERKMNTTNSKRRALIGEQ